MSRDEHERRWDELMERLGVEPELRYLDEDEIQAELDALDAEHGAEGAGTAELEAQLEQLAASQATLLRAARESQAALAELRQEVRALRRRLPAAARKERVAVGADEALLPAQDPPPLVGGEAAAAGEDVDGATEREHSSAPPNPRRRLGGRPALFLLGGAVTAALLMIERPGSDGFQALVAAAHVPVIAVCFLLTFTRAGRGSSRERCVTEVARKACAQFRFGWSWLWGSWLALYVWFSALLLVLPHVGVDLSAPLPHAAAWAVADVLNLFASFWFFFLFLVLDRPSVPVRENLERDRGFKRSLLLLGLGCVALAVLSVLGRLNDNDLGPFLGSFFAALSMVYLFGRLDSRHMRIARWQLAPLYLYALLQLAWHQFSADDVGAFAWLHDLALILALYLKVYVFTMITKWLRDGTLHGYLDVVTFPRGVEDFERLRE